jgi:hypothetical protein
MTLLRNSPTVQLTRHLSRTFTSYRRSWLTRELNAYVAQALIALPSEGLQIDPSGILDDLALDTIS